MLPLGHLGPHPGEGDVRDTKFTKDEQRTLLTLWSIMRSPLMIGGNLPASDAWTLSLLTNAEVIAVKQQSRRNRPVVANEDAVVWRAEACKPAECSIPSAVPGKSDYYVAVFNLLDTEKTLQYDWKELGLAPGTYGLRDLWEAKDLGKAAALSAKLPPHACILYRISAVGGER
jgi:alpha-galactosidase